MMPKIQIDVTSALLAFEGLLHMERSVKQWADVGGEQAEPAIERHRLLQEACDDFRNALRGGRHGD